MARLPLLILLAMAMAATAYVLVRGVMNMASGKDVTGEQSQQWMRTRVLFQACAIVVALTDVTDPPLKAMLAAIQNELFDLGADLSTPGEDFAPSEMTLRIVPAQIDRLEREIDRMNEDLVALRSFILPGGAGGSAPLHLARAVVRRAERTAVGAGAGFNPLALTYLNRLSDHLFVLARWVAREGGG